MSALRGLRILDLSRLLPGGFLTQLFADLGADVVKVEDTGAGDYLRWSQPSYEGPDDSARSAAFLWLNRGKRSIRVDLKQQQGRELLLELARGADVLVESFRPGALDRLGLGWEALAAANRRLVLCSISGYGQGAAVRERDVSGVGQHVVAALFHASLIWLGLLVAKQLCDGEPVRRGVTERAVCHRLYACADGHVALAALEPKFWQAFCRGVQREDLIAHQWDAEGSEAHAALARLFATRTRAQWQAFASEHDCCLEPVLELDEALASPLARDRGILATLEQTGAIAGPHRQGARGSFLS